MSMPVNQSAPVDKKRAIEVLRPAAPKAGPCQIRVKGYVDPSGQEIG